MHINCKFNLPRSSAVYYTGEQISGSFSLTISKKKALQLEALSITLFGCSTICWQEAQTLMPHVEHNDSTAVTETACLKFEGSKTHLLQSQQLLEAVILPPGCTQCCNFEFELPSALPGSCRLPLGSTSYMLQVTLHRRGKHDKCFQQRLCIRNRIEFTDLQPAKCATATLQLSLPRTVYAPGQRVAYQLAATSPATCTTRLCQSITYQSQQPSTKAKQVLTVLDESSDLKAALHLPLTAPIMSQLPGELIAIAYYLETWTSCNEPLRLPLLVGTVAPPVEIDFPAHGFVNLALCENDLQISSVNHRLPHSCSQEFNAPSVSRRGEHLKLLRRQKKQSYLRLALRYFNKNLLPAH
ncbi:uncharacterized protein LOC6563270 [Drosophila grimshawi]|uniref:GH18617 n=1 Tax=Drosophila grimshawi TaxID=7222 RepID=B4JHJ3_DROGR|nr:uncharacterized protein LOC6563270 [Drosophila grimshawi]EDV92820.1 GH18617 [Drosophila grimshawi]